MDNDKYKELTKTISAMSEPLRHAYEEIQPLWRDAIKKDVLNQYQMALRIREVRDQDGTPNYGARAVERLAEALGTSATTLRAYAKVADIFAEDDIHEIVNQKDLYGKSVTWSHLVVLVRVQCQLRRGRLLTETLENGWSVRELTARTHQQDDESEAAEPETADADPEMEDGDLEGEWESEDSDPGVDVAQEPEESELEHPDGDWQRQEDPEQPENGEREPAVSRLQSEVQRLRNESQVDNRRAERLEAVVTAVIEEEQDGLSSETRTTVDEALDVTREIIKRWQEVVVILEGVDAEAVTVT